MVTYGAGDQIEITSTTTARDDERRMPAADAAVIRHPEYRDEPAFDLGSNEGPEVMPENPTPEFVRHFRRVTSSLLGDNFKPGRMNCINCSRCGNCNFTRPQVGVIYTNGIEAIGKYFADGYVKVFCCGKCRIDTLREMEEYPDFLSKGELHTYYTEAWDRIIKDMTYTERWESLTNEAGRPASRLVKERFSEEQIDKTRLLTVCASAAKATCANVYDPYDSALGHLCVAYGHEIGLP